MTHPPSITVVAAVVEEDGRFLVTSRPAGVHLAGLWEFPGGKIAIDESHDAALGREMREELDVDVDVHELILSTSHTYPERIVTLFFYRCSMRGRPRPLIGQQVRWVTARELADLEFPPADDELIKMIVNGSSV